MALDDTKVIKNAADFAASLMPRYITQFQLYF